MAMRAAVRSAAAARRRPLSSAAAAAAAARPRGVVYEAHGDPAAVLRVRELEALPARLGAGEVRVRMLAAPINPADLNMVEGTYSLLPPLPAVGGNEGVAVVEEVGEGVSAVRPGEWVLPAEAGGFGTWRTEAVCDEAALSRVPSDIPLESAATLAVNPCTAYRMLHDFARLEPGDVVAQNGATSGVGVAVIQLARAMGLRTVNVVRDRDTDERLRGTVEALEAFGADAVLTDSQVSRGAARDLFSADGGGLPRPRLALNCVGGRSATELSRMLDHGGQLVTYGGMSRKPVLLPTGPLIFKDLAFRGFWMTRWARERPREEREAMLAELAALARDGRLVAPCESFALDDFDAALAYHHEAFRGRKALLRM